MTKIQKQLKTLAANKNRKVTQMLVGKIQKEIQSWSMSVELKRAAYRQVLRVSGLTNEEIIATYADAYIR